MEAGTEKRDSSEGQQRESVQQFSRLLDTPCE